MLAVSHDNQKIPLKKLQAFVINNNSNVFIANNNIIEDNLSGITTITINKGNTVNLLLIASGNYDVVYGNSTLYSSKENFIDSQHEYLTDYNFPAARINVNGNKSVYAILLNNLLKKPYWSPLSAGIMLDDLVANDLSSIPTRMNGYTATINHFTDDVISSNYNGSLIIGTVNKPLTTNFVYSLSFKSNISNSSKKININNAVYLEITNTINNEVLIRNVRYSLLYSTRNITLQNSNIAIKLKDRISVNSYNTTISYDVNSVEYKNYILKGLKTIPSLLLNTTRNIFIDKIKYLKQDLHPINLQNGYKSNLPIGAILWYPEVWSSLSPHIDKNNTDTDKPKLIISRGEPDTTDWALCDGSTIPADSLYTQLYGLTTTPNYKVDLLFYKPMTEATAAGPKGWHYLTLQSCVQLISDKNNSIVSTYPTYVAMSKDMAAEGADNEHKQNHVTLKQNLSGAYDLQMKVWGNWRSEPYVNMHFEINTNLLPHVSIGEIYNKFALLFDSFCCDGAGWWKGWTGGKISELRSKAPLLFEKIDGVEYLGGYPLNNVSNGSNDSLWLDTVNVPKMAVRVAPNSTNKVSLEWVKEAGDENYHKVTPLFSNGQTALRAYYTIGTWGTGTNMYCSWEPDGGHDCDPTYEHLQGQKLNYKLKKYKVIYNGPVPEDGIIEFDLQFQAGTPAISGALSNNPGKRTYGRWCNYRNRDDSENKHFYHSFVQIDYVTMFSNLMVRWGGLAVRAIPLKKGTDVTYGGYNVMHWSQDDWPTTTNHKNVPKNKREQMMYQNLGLYRRLNPYIKINDLNLKKEILPDEDMEYKYYENPVSLIQFRKTIDSQIASKLHLNDNDVRNNKLSTCYCLNNYNVLINNISNFDYTILKLDLSAFYDLISLSATISCNNSCYCNIWKRKDSSDFNYILLLDGKEFKNLFQSINKQFEQDDGTFITAPTWPNCVTVTKNLNLYRSLSYDSDSSTTIPDITYSFYNIQENNGNYTVTINDDLLKLAAKYNALTNTIKAISYLPINNYLNTTPNSIPIFYTDENDNNNINLSSKANIINDGNGITLYPLLGTNYKVMSANNVDVSSYQYSFNYEESLSSVKVGNYEETSAYINYLWKPLVSSTLKDNTFLNYNTSYILSTTLATPIESISVNAQIYQKITKYTDHLSSEIDRLSSIEISTFLESTAFSAYWSEASGLDNPSLDDNPIPVTILPTT